MQNEDIEVGGPIEDEAMDTLYGMIDDMLTRRLITEGVSSEEKEHISEMLMHLQIAWDELPEFEDEDEDEERRLVMTGEIDPPDSFN